MLKLPKDTPPMSAELASVALTLIRLGFKQHQAAAMLGVNQGRISEVVTGKRFVGVAPLPPDQLFFDL
jgi:plasmid maintenance system antidote protein VapI